MAQRPSRVQVLAPAASLVDRTDIEILDHAAKPINAFEKALGGRKALINELAIDGTPEIKELVRLLLDPRYDGRSIGWLASHVNISLTDLLRAYRNAMLAKAQIASAQAIARKLPAIVEDVMMRAVPHLETCSGCDGTGKMTKLPGKRSITGPVQINCTLCRGKGKRMVAPELEHQRLALELGELIKTPRGGPTLLQQFNLNPGSAAGSADPGSLERMQQAVGEMLYGRNSVIDVVPEDPGGR